MNGFIAYSVPAKYIPWVEFEGAEIWADMPDITKIEKRIIFWVMDAGRIVSESWRIVRKGDCPPMPPSKMCSAR